MFRIAICDDEKYFREWMKEMLLQYMKDSGTYYDIDIFQSRKDLLELGIEINQYKIIFLDINMDEIDGMMTAQKIRERNEDIFIVFVTAFVNYSIEGYKVDAFRYLLKSNTNMSENIAECMDAIQRKMKYNVIWKEFEFNEGKKKISLNRILYIESRLHKVKFHVMEDFMVEYSIYETLNNMESYINSKDFLRIHQSFLVNMRYVKSICKYEATLHNGKSFPIPKGRYKGVLDTYVAYKGEV